MPAIFHIIVAAILASLIALLIWARRGRRIDVHPLCRRCRYDLSGSPEPLTRCSECGADLARPRAVRVGNRRPRRRVMWVAGALLIPTLLVGGFDAYVVIRGVDTMRLKPVWWLLRDAKSASSADAAVAELMRRDTEGKLSADQLNELFGAMASLHVDPNYKWPRGWTTYIEPRLDAASDEVRGLYWAHAVDLRLKLTPSAGSTNWMLQVEVGAWPGRYGNDGLNCVWKPIAFTVDGVKAAVPDVAGGMRDVPDWAVQGGGTLGEIYLTHVDPAKVPSRTVNVDLTLELTVTPTHTGVLRGLRASPAVAGRAGTGQRTIRAAVALPAGVVPVRVLTDPALANAAQKNIAIHDAEYGRQPWDATLFRMTLDCTHAPANMAYAMTLCHRGANSGWALGTFFCKQGESKTITVSSPVFGLGRGSPVDLLLTPASEIAATSGFTSVSGVPVRIENLPIAWGSPK